MNKLSKELPTKPGADSPQAGLSQRYLAFVGEFRFNKLLCWEALYFSVRLTLAMTDSNLFSNKDPLGRGQTVSHEEQYPCSEYRLLSTSMDAHVIC